MERQAWAAWEHAETMRCEAEHRADESSDPDARHRLRAVARLHDRIAESARGFVARARRGEVAP